MAVYHCHVSKGIWKLAVRAVEIVNHSVVKVHLPRYHVSSEYVSDKRVDRQIDGCLVCHLQYLFNLVTGQRDVSLSGY